MSDYSTIQQHQPLRTPSSFDKQGKALIVQLDEIFDDIYRRFGRLKVSDMGTELRTWIAETDTGIATLDVAVEQISISVSNKYDKVSGISITVDGIDISGSKYIRIESGNSLEIKSGGTISIDSGNFSVDSSGNVGIKGNVEISSGKSLTIKTGGSLALDSTNFAIDSDGNVTLKGDVTIRANKGLAIESGGTFTVASDNFNINSSGAVYMKGDVSILAGKSLSVASTGSIYISTGGTFTIQSGKFAIDANGNATFGGTLNAAGGTFAGTLSAGCITSGTLNCSNITVSNFDAGSISTGTLNCANLTVTNFDAGSITTGTLNCTNLTVTGLTASDIKGGTLALGGLNNTDGSIVMKDASGTSIGTWDNTGLKASGEFSSGFWKLDANGMLCTANSGKFILRNKQTSGGDNDEIGINYKYAIGTGDAQTPNFEFFAGSRYVGFQLLENKTYLYSSADLYIGPKQVGYSDGYVSNGYFTDLYYTNIHAPSSRSFKHDIQKIGSVGCRLDQLEPVSFVYNDDPRCQKHFGLIFEDTLDVIPEICHKDGTKSINYIELIPMLLKEIQELRNRVFILEAVTDV